MFVIDVTTKREGRQNRKAMSKGRFYRDLKLQTKPTPKQLLEQKVILAMGANLFTVMTHAMPLKPNPRP
eukprot:4371055-Amphidinium_carterae.1